MDIFWTYSNDSHRPGNGLDADGVKLYCGQMGKNVADRAIQVRKGFLNVTPQKKWNLKNGGLQQNSHPFSGDDFQVPC